MDKVSVIIPAFNEEKYIGACLESLSRFGGNAIGEILVIDNASTDGTAKVAAAFPGVRVVREDCKGPSFARQRGFDEARFPLLAYLDADCRITPEWIGVARRAWEKDAKLLCISGPYMYTKADLPSAIQRAFAWTFWFIIAPVTYAVTRFALTGGNFIVKKEALQNIGGIDTSIAFYGDDTNLARRLHTTGRVLFTTSFVCYTSGRRLQQNFAGTSLKYVLNYLSEAFLHRPVTKRYDDIR